MMSDTYQRELEKEVKQLRAELAALSWIKCSDRLPDWSQRDDTPCIHPTTKKAIGAGLRSNRVQVAFDDAGQVCVSSDVLTSIEGSGIVWWERYGDRVLYWAPMLNPPTNKGDAPL